MNKRQLGGSELQVSELCLGTMTFGQQNTQDQAHALLDCAVEHGVNFIDAAEMYPVPARAETQGRTESIIGQWLKRQPRDRFILATKVTGRQRGMPWLRGEQRKVDRANIRAAVEGSLQRLQTDSIDLYQIHWPERNVPMFGRADFEPVREYPATPIRDQLEALAELVKEGKIRYVGLSNETPWGVCAFVKAAEIYGLPRIVSIQNAYSLLNRTYENGLAEVGFREQVGLLAYSPLAFGLLSGKYLDDARPSGARLVAFPEFGARYRKSGVPEAVRAYRDLARVHGLSPAVMALAFARSRWFVASTLIGATTLEQLRENLSSAHVKLSPETLQGIAAIHRQYYNLTP